MVDNSLRSIPTVTLNPDGTVSLQSLNEVIRRLQMDIYAVEGRTGPTTLRDDTTVVGTLTLEGLDVEPEVGEVGTTVLYMNSVTGTLRASINGAAYVDIP